MKKGILVVSFGTTYKETREKNIEVLEQEIQKSYPEAVCYRAFSSGIIRKILKERDGLYVMDMQEALEQMIKDGITHAYVQPTHIIDGIENHRLQEAVERCKSGFETIEIGAPLLEQATDYEKAAKTLWEGLLPEAEGKNLILMGHGTSHEANEAYKKLEDTFRRLGYLDVYVATVEAEPTIEDIILRINEKEKKPVLVTPFMLVAGDHAVNDMAGEEDSYRSKLTEAGYETQIVLKGLGEYAGIREIYKSHLAEAMNGK